MILKKIALARDPSTYVREELTVELDLDKPLKAGQQIIEEEAGDLGLGYVIRAHLEHQAFGWVMAAS